MAKVIYDNKECEVISVETEWGWSVYDGERMRKPCDTWLLLNIAGHLAWINAYDCRGI